MSPMLRAAIILAFAIGVVWTGEASAAAWPGDARLERRRFLAFASREFGCHHPTPTKEFGKFWYSLACDYRKSGMHWLDFGLSPDRRRVVAVDFFVLLYTQDRRVPAWQPPLARRSATRLLRYIVRDRGQSARWTNLALERTMTGHCSQHRRAGGFLIEVDRMSPVDLLIRNAEVRIAREKLPPVFGDGNCF
jgi:hypothetical protein